MIPLAMRQAFKTMLTGRTGSAHIDVPLNCFAEEADVDVPEPALWRDGTTFKGMEGLRDYLARNDGQFTENFSRKLLGYALGRSVLPSDKELLAKIGASIRANEGRVSAAVAEIVTSRQFMNRRREAPVLATNP